MIREVCVENFTDVPRAIEAGADRIELNNNLSVGGTTPSFGVIKKVVNYAHDRDVPVIVMIRPRAGNFVYSKDEIEIMKSDIEICSLLGADGIALGCLTNNDQFDLENMTTLTKIANSLNLDVVMHMAFDEIPKNGQKEVIATLVSLQIRRILTHGGSLSDSIESCIPHLNEIIDWADNQIEILPGGGITNKNADKINEQLNINQLHGTKILGDLRE